MYVEKERIDELRKFMFENFTDELIPKNKKKFCRPHIDIIKEDNFYEYSSYFFNNKVAFEMLTHRDWVYYGRKTRLDLLELKNTFEVFNGIEEIDKDHYGVFYLEEFDENGKSKLDMLSEHKQKHKDILIESVYPSSPDYVSFTVHHPYFAPAPVNKTNKRKYYFFVDEEQEVGLRNAAIEVLDNEPNIKKLKVESLEFNINNLVWIEFEEEFLVNRAGSQHAIHKAYELILELSKRYLSFCEFMDSDGSISFDFRSYIKAPSIYNDGYRDDLGEGFNSNWEADFARILNHLNIGWEYEKERFMFGNNQSYLPDFFLTDNRIIETKGFWDNLSRQRIKLFLENRNDYSFFPLDSDMFISLERMYKPYIENWESSDIKLSAETIPVVGITFGNRKKLVQELQIGMELYLEREPKNKFDSNAIKVMNQQGLQIGFVSADWTPVYAPKLDLGMKYNVIIKNIEPKVIEVDLIRNNPAENIVYDFLKGAAE